MKIFTKRLQTIRALLQRITRPALLTQVCGSLASKFNGITLRLTLLCPYLHSLRKTAKEDAPLTFTRTR